MKIKTISRIIAVIIILANICFLPITYNLLIKFNNPLGFKIIILFFIVPIHIFIISAVLAFSKKYEENQSILSINALALFLILLFLLLFIQY